MRRRPTALRWFVPGGAALLLCLAVCLCVGPALAQEVGNLDRLEDAFTAAVDPMAERLAQLARNLVFTLLLIEMAWTLGRSVLGGADFGSLMGEVFRRIIIAGFFLFLIDGIPTQNGTVGLSTFILQSAEGLLGVASTGTSEIRPNTILTMMYSTGGRIYENASGLGGTVSAALVWLGLVLLGAVIAGMMIVTYVEIHIVFTVGVLALGFGVWRQTEDFARRVLITGVARIFRLFTLLVIAVVIKVQLEEFGGLSSFEDGFIIIGLGLIFAMALTSVPASVEAMIASSGQPAAADQAKQQIAETAKRSSGRLVGTSAKIAGKGVSAGTRMAGRTAGRMAGRGLAARLRSIVTKGAP